ncbi:hypothetical protein ElyMa_006912000 [Elysia marginata]|uniref:Uncharacterized protein n=1 Tax=Elysia marginata TaxID=1093978 RepID=A0AAV4JF42_9GAST|nr:hypothetical protein ElyMa_006912000 [Elysia marginata]
MAVLMEAKVNTTTKVDMVLKEVTEVKVNMADSTKGKEFTLGEATTKDTTTEVMAKGTMTVEAIHAVTEDSGRFIG